MNCIVCNAAEAQTEFTYKDLHEDLGIESRDNINNGLLEDDIKVVIEGIPEGIDVLFKDPHCRKCAFSKWLKEKMLWVEHQQAGDLKEWLFIRAGVT